MMNFLFKLPGFKNIYNKFKSYDSKINDLEQQLQYLNADLIRRNHLEKYKRGEKINLVFVCHRPQVWNSLKTVFEACNSDEAFNVTIVAIPLKKQLPKIGFNHEIYESEGAEDFWKDYPCKVINGYDYETKEWFDIKNLEPDYVFFQQPYNIAKSELYKSWNVAKYATICHIDYFYPPEKKITLKCMPDDFLRNVSLFFIQHKDERDWVQEKFRETQNYFTRSFLVGSPRLDNLSEYKNSESKTWKLNGNEAFRIVWTPRWTTNENNCHFFEYKDKFLAYCDEHSDVDFVFRPHPQAFLNYAANNNFSLEASKEYEREYGKRKNMTIDHTADFLPLFYSSNVLISDYTSIVPEYFLTGNPIIYCKNEKSLYDNEGKFTEGFYYAKDWNEVEFFLNELKNGNDSLKEKRHELIKTEFSFSENGAGNAIKELIKKDFAGQL